MHLKRYRSKSVRDALAQARADLGADALVLSTRLVGDRGWRGWLGQRVVEITAAANRDMSESRPSERPLRQPPSAPSVLPAPPREALRPPQPEGHASPIAARLRAAGLDPILAADVAAAIPEARRRHASVALLRRTVADRLGALAAGSETFATADVFIGPPGVGKTTTIAKIAAQERALHGLRVGIVAADGFRVGAVEQLRLYAEIIGSPFLVARTPGDLATVLSASATGPLLVDTPGRSVRDRHAQELLEFLGTWQASRRHLVMSAATTPRDAAALLDAYAAAHPTRVVLTRLDEAPSFGPLIALLRERQLPITFLGTGQRVPEDLSRATAATLAAHVLGEAPEQIGDRA